MKAIIITLHRRLKQLYRYYFYQTPIPIPFQSCIINRHGTLRKFKEQQLTQTDSDSNRPFLNSILLGTHTPNSNLLSRAHNRATGWKLRQSLVAEMKTKLPGHDDETIHYLPSLLHHQRLVSVHDLKKTRNHGHCYICSCLNTLFKGATESSLHQNLLDTSEACKHI